MRTLVLCLGALICGGYAAAGYLAPESLPAALRSGEPGLHPSYEEVYARCDAAMRAKRPRLALDWADEYLLATGARDEFARDVEGLRQLAKARGAEGPAGWEERGQGWRFTRVALRRPLGQHVAAVLSLLLLGTAAVSAWRSRARARDRARGEPPGGPLRPPRGDWR